MQTSQNKTELAGKNKLGKAALGLVLSCLLLQTATQTQAVTYGEPDNAKHPYVGLAIFYNEEGDPLWRCSCSAISPTVILTAGHCTIGAASVRVWFEDTVTDLFFPFGGGNSFEGVPVAHPQTWAAFPDTRDLGVIILTDPVAMPRYAQLPSAGALDTLSKRRGTQDQSFTIVGYGLQGIKPVFSAELTRMTGTTQLVNLLSANTDGFNIQLTGSPGEGHGSGGISFGDSGGPTFLGDSDIVVGINSFVINPLAKGTGFSYRTDLQSSLDWINQFLEE